MKQEPERHLPYYRLLEGFKRARLCPLCALESESLHRRIDAFLYEGVNDPELRERLARSRGYCARHAEALLGFRNGHATAILYQDHVSAFLQLLDRLADVPRRMASKEMSRYQDRTECPLCRYERELRRHYISTLAEGLGHEEMRAAFRSSPGLCVSHFLVAFSAVKGDEVRRFLIEVERQKFRDLLHDLKEFRRKHDYRYAHEGFGKEADSWERAVRMVAGDQYRRAPAQS